MQCAPIIHNYYAGYYDHGTSDSGDDFDYDDNDDDDAFGGVHHDADDVVVGDDDFEDFLVELIVFPTILLKLHFDVLYCINRLMQCNVQKWNNQITFPELVNICCYFFQDKVRENEVRNVQTA